jgi:hypothetical protein
MLHKETVDRNTLELIEKFQSDTMLQDFVLVGGTALSLQIGHRLSIDIDFFSKEEFDPQELLEHLEQHYGFREQYRHKNTLKGIVNGISVDLLRHNYDYVVPPKSVGGITMASKQDIAAMKVNAITGDGTRVKDFIDIYFLLKDFSFADIIGFYKTKYNARNDFHAIKSLTYFDDIVKEAWPRMILEKSLTLEQISEEIIRHRDKYLNDQS